MAVYLSPPLMASQTLILANPTCTPLSPLIPISRSLPLSPLTPISLSLRRSLPPISLSLHRSVPLSPLRSKSALSAASSFPPPPIPTQNPTQSPLTGTTRTITTLFSLALSLAKLLALKLKLFVPLANTTTLTSAAGPLFFAAIGDLGAGPRSAGAPIAVIASGLARWLEIYSCVLLIRVLLSWFPNMPWDKQPFSAVRDLCDPYLSLFRGIIPPLFNSLDVSPILAFLLLGMLGQFARAPRS